MQGPQALPPLRTRIYIDGYNFYYGCLKGTPYKWLDLLPLFAQQILPSILVRDAAGQPRSFDLLPSPSIKLFTAPILETVAKAPDSVSSQAQYHKALRLMHPGRIELIKGYYAVQEMKVRVVDAEQPKKPPKDCQELLAWKVEEKQSDVNLALQAYHDAITGQIDQAVIVTNDTDIAPALEMIRSHTSVLIGLVVPTRDATRRPNQALVEQAHWKRTHITVAELAACQLPRVIPDRRRPATKPDSWYAHPELLQEVIALAKPILGDRAKVFQWLEKPFARLDGQRPIELMETEAGAQRVLAYIQDYIASIAEAARPALDQP
ncbi:antitoxin Xre/MbcA/ParS toxin-binding domain-containing protein [Pseudomonas oryzihabitans]|uniref:antitoxin Xre/MbcA/ParS toxin-binding domain-containing protein n=1 Tax=Pseudomonas oryzihabitans TaxID=47885 RepID=UPI002860BFE7|nr:antitoxin Xre/MbcA/ParS toxin-binding domain-containing protein [Pseudomonas psychrotolerans]MDR6680173.1 6-hydroxy-3-succinoylpyridine 3-monooxygenase [Pseudomonas psychrotolerans]